MGNAVVFYTTDGNPPTHASPVYSGPIQINGNQAIHALAYYPGVCTDSTIALAVFTIGGVCTPGDSQCSGGSAVQTCGVTGQWGVPWPCATGTCGAGACTGSAMTAVSCQGSASPGLTDCGASSESCCASPEVAGGTYYRTYTYGETSSYIDSATVSGSRLDKYLVTVGRFRQFVAAWNGGAGYTPPAGSGKHLHLNGGNGLNATAGGYEPGWVASDDSNIAPTNSNLSCVDPTYVTWTPIASPLDTLPINCANWYEAYAFCIWDGGFLPSEAEWEYAAAGGSQQLEYPWGSTDPGSNNEYAIYDGDYAAAPFAPSYIAPAGTATLEAGLWGQLDLTGELSEWNLDWYADYVDPCTDCAHTTADTTAASLRVVRGGSFAGSAELPPSRSTGTPFERSYYTGFRCARTP